MIYTLNMWVWGMFVFVESIVEKQVTCPQMLSHNVSSPSQRPPNHVRVLVGYTLGGFHTLGWLSRFDPSSIWIWAPKLSETRDFLCQTTSRLLQNFRTQVVIRVGNIVVHTKFQVLLERWEQECVAALFLYREKGKEKWKWRRHREDSDGWCKTSPYPDSGEFQW